MIKKVSAICLFVFLCVFCMSATIETDNLETASYAEDGLVLDTDEMQFEDNQLEKYEFELFNYVDVVDNQIVVDYESIEKLGDYSDTISLIRENAEFANSLAEEKPEIVTINDDLSLSFDIEDEYAEQWDAWKLSWSFWKGWSFKLDSDFGKLVGISGIVYNLISKISNGAAFYKKLLSITDKSYLASTLSTLFFYLPCAGVKDIIATYLRNYAVGYSFWVSNNKYDANDIKLCFFRYWLVNI